MSSTLFPITSGTLSFTPGIPSVTAARATTFSLGDNVHLGRADGRQADVLTTAAGAPVYTLSGDTPRHPECTRANGCFRVWHPVTVASTVRPTKPSNVPGHLGVWRRGRLRQVTLNGRPLYTFAGDTVSSVAAGAGLRSFRGTWKVVRTPAALTPSPVPTPSPSPSPPIY
jgi:predicted lipoprotein with Yx(FWY)xxD motif